MAALGGGSSNSNHSQVLECKLSCLSPGPSCDPAGLARSPSVEPPLPEAAAPSSGGGMPPDSRVGAERADPKDEARRARMRQVLPGSERCTSTAILVLTRVPARAVRSWPEL